MIAHDKKENKFADLFELGLTVLAPDLTTSYIELLEAHFGDKNGTISWWLYEASPRSESTCLWTEDADIPMHTIQDLYNYLQGVCNA